MSSVYATEPPTEGKIILHTSLGPLDVELWTKQAPLATKNFIQLCLEGYYDNTIFHRVEKNFLIQGGDPTGTGEGGESVYGAPFKDEYHSRLRFTHRGLVACASHGRNNNGSQFFITLDQTPELQNKHTIFGKVTGDSLYNLIPINSMETDSDDRPLRPPRVIRAEVLWDPFDIVPREKRAPEKKEEPKAAKPQGVKNKALLSFAGDDDDDNEDEDDAPPTKSFKMVSRHVALPPQPRRRKGATPLEEVAGPLPPPEGLDDRKEPKNQNTIDNNKHQTTKKDQQDTTKESKKKNKKKANTQLNDVKMVEEDLPKAEEDNEANGETLPKETTEDNINDEMDIEIKTAKQKKDTTYIAPSSEPVLDERQKQVKKETKELLRELRGKKTEDKSKDDDSAKSKLKAKREKYLKKPKRDASAIDMGFGAFKQSLKGSSAEWKAHKLQFEADENPIVDLHDIEDYTVFDPKLGRQKTEDEKRYNKHNLNLRAQKKLDEW